MRRPVPAIVRAQATYPSLPAPVRGWIENENLARNGGQGCSVLENWFPLQATVRLRGGHLKSATVGSSPVLSLITWQSGGISKFFAATASAVFDISSLNADTAPSAAFSGQTSGRWSWVQFGTSGGNYVVMVNGTDNPRYYDGSTWTEITGVSSPIAITGVTPSTLSHVWMHSNRIWAVKKGTPDAYYLPVDVIGGSMTKFPLGSVFRRGGSLLFGETWSGDSGDGMDDRCIFVSDQGEVAVYQGIDPSDADTWSLVGRYDISRPTGVTTVRAGGDVLIAMNDGIVPISAVVVKDPAALALSAVTRAIEPSWRRAMRLTDTEPVQIFKWPRESMMLVGLPNDPSTMFAVNMQTGAWAKWTGMSAQCFGLYNDRAYFGASDGKVYAVEASGEDNELPYVCRMSMLPDPLGAPGAVKSIKQARATFRALAPFTARLSVATDYRTDFPTPPNAVINDSTPALWDVGLWDVSKWDDGEDSELRQTVSTRWRSIGRLGFTAGAQVQVTCSGTRKPDAELVAFDLSVVPGAVVV